MADDSHPRSPVERPPLALWLWLRGYNWKQAGDLFRCSGEAVRLWCLPYDDPNRRMPDEASLTNIKAGTGGAITAADFYPPHLRQDAPATQPEGVRS